MSFVLGGGRRAGRRAEGGGRRAEGGGRRGERGTGGEGEELCVPRWEYRQQLCSQRLLQSCMDKDSVHIAQEAAVTVGCLSMFK